MNTVMLALVVALVCASPTLQDWVDPQTACSQIGTYYSQGCTGLVAALLGQSWQHSSAYRFGRKLRIGDDPPGTVVGFRGHVAVYIGYGACGYRFVDVPAPNRRARGLNSYGRDVYLAYY